jgi:hypothetical protein
MFRLISDEDYERDASAGTRPLFAVGHFVFQDGMDGDGRLHHLVVEHGEEEDLFFEADQAVMYELVARYLAGEYEKAAYDLAFSPGHHALLDLLELATARARAGETDFDLAELDGAAEEILDDEEPEEDPA